MVELYAKPSTMIKVFLMMYLFNIKMVEVESIFDYSNDFNRVNNQLSSINVNFDEEIRTLLILCLS